MFDLMRSRPETEPTAKTTPTEINELKQESSDPTAALELDSNLQETTTTLPTRKTSDSAPKQKNTYPNREQQDTQPSFNLPDNLGIGGIKESLAYFSKPEDFEKPPSQQEGFHSDPSPNSL